MLQRLANGWQLIKACAAVLRADKELILFPILSSIGVLLVVASFVVPSLLAGLLDNLVAGKVPNLEIFGLILLFLFYLAQYSVILFSNAALVGAALIRLQGGDPTIRDGVRIAFEHIGPILGYAVINTVVSLLVQSGSGSRARGRHGGRRGGLLGGFVASMIGMAWSLATFLVVPVLVTEDVGPIEAVKRSAAYLKKTWGEQIVGNFGMGAIFGLAGFLGSLAILAPGFFLAYYLQSLALGFAAVALMVLWIVAVGLVNSTLHGIYSAAVYRYAVDGVTGGYLREDLVRQAFRSG
jgi:hypothetical protein